MQIDKRNMPSAPASWTLPAIVLIAIHLLAAPAQAQGVRPETVASGLQTPWGLAFLPEGRFLVTERPGRLRVIEADGRVGAPVAGLPDMAVGGQGGLLDVATDSEFARNRTLYFCFSEPGAGGNSTALARARLSADASRLEELRILFSQKPKVSSSLHFGCRIVEARATGLVSRRSMSRRVRSRSTATRDWCMRFAQRSRQR